MTSRGKKAKPGTADDIKHLKQIRQVLLLQINYLANDEVVAKISKL